jgi:hypothetical protein
VVERVEAGARRLCDSGPLPLASVAGLVGAVAATVADLHAMGVVHGAIRPEHVLLERDGRPVLCGLDASAPADDAGRAADVQALGELLRGLLAAATRHGADSGHTRPALLALALRAANSAPGAGPSAAELAAGVGARAQPRPRPAPQSPRPPRRRIAARLVVVAVGVALTLAGIGMLDGEGTPATRPRSPSRGPALELASGVLTAGAARWSVAGRVDTAVSGDWDCDGHRTFAFLDRASGHVYRSDAWPMGDVVSVPLVAQVDGALGLRAVSRRAGRCDELTVLRRGGGAVVP